MRQIYLDNAATTALSAEAMAAMEPFLTQFYGNPSSIHGAGRETRRALDASRSEVAGLIGCKPQQIVFTSSGTEAIHQALFGAFLGNHERRHIVTTAFEHHAVLHTCELLEELGAKVTYVEPRDDCRVHVEDVIDALQPDTLLVSVMGVNNETGSIQAVNEIVQSVKAEDDAILVHSDVVQALPVQRINLAESELDFASFSAHKIHGPKGVGAMYIKSNRNWVSVLRGGNQERERRGGTENVPGIVGFGAAAAVLQRDFEVQQKHLAELRNRFWNELAKIAGVYRNSPIDAASTILNVGFKGVPNDVLLMRLDLEGVAASAGSACTAGSLQPSHVLKACGLSNDVLKEAVRFSFSVLTELNDIVEAAERVTATVHAIRGY